MGRMPGKRWYRNPAGIFARQATSGGTLAYAALGPSAGVPGAVARRRGGIPRVLAFAPLALATGGVLLFLPRLRNLEELGYLGVFLANLLSSATFVVPVPGVAVTMLAAVYWDPWLVGLAAATGSTLGELGAYLAGAGLRSRMDQMMSRHRPCPRIKAAVARHGTLTLFALAAIPNPFFDIAGLAAASLGYPVHRFVLVCWLGKTVKFLLAALTGFWALPALLRVLHS